MKKKRHALVFLLMFVLASCGKHYTHHPKILAAEKSLASSPDSSLRLLLSVSSPQALPEADRAAWCLHYAHAMYKLQKEDSVPNSLIDIAIKYYDGSSLYKYSGTAYYLKGCYAESHKKPRKALLYYKKALLLLENTQEYDIRGLTALNIVYLYYGQKVIREAESYAFEAKKDFELSGNKNYQMYCYQMIGEFYYNSYSPTDSILRYYEKAGRLAKVLGNETMYYFIQGLKGSTLYASQPQKAIRLLKEAYNHDQANQEIHNIFLSYCYAQIQKPDSAAYYLRLVENSKSRIQDSLAYYASRSYINATRKNYQQAYEDAKKAYILNEKNFQGKIKDQLYRIDKQYDLTEKQKENLELKIANQGKVLLISATVILLLGACIFSIIIRNKSKRRQAELETKNKKLQYEMEVKKLEHQKKHDLLLAKLKQKLELTLEFRRMQNRPAAIEKQEEIMDRIIRTVILHKGEWDYYVKEVDELSGNKLQEMQEKHKDVTKSDLIVIALLYLGINIGDSCLLLGMAKETMYTRRKRIRKHLEIADETELEEWLAATLQTAH